MVPIAYQEETIKSKMIHARRSEVNLHDYIEVCIQFMILAWKYNLPERVGFQIHA